MDRTTTIRASVRDVQFTLILTIALVVMVIFVFLRNSARDDHSRRGRAAFASSARSRSCTALGYSLDNLSLMALTIAVGFVVDDAIVVLENIERHVEDGMTPIRGRAEGRRRDRLHGPLDQPLAGRRVHPAAVHGRHRRAPLPRVRRDGDDRHPGLGIRVADPDADAGVRGS